MKTRYTDEDVHAFIDRFVQSEQKKSDSFQLIRLFEKITQEPARMWGPTIIGFGNYHYRYESGHEGSAPIISFSPRKAALTLYVYVDNPTSEKRLKQLGKYKKTKGCIYVSKLSDINLDVLEALCQECISQLRKLYN